MAVPKHKRPKSKSRQNKVDVSLKREKGFDIFN